MSDDTLENVLSLLLAFSFRNEQQTTGIRSSKESPKSLITTLWRKTYLSEGWMKNKIISNAFAARGKWTKPNCTIAVIPCAAVPRLCSILTRCCLLLQDHYSVIQCPFPCCLSADTIPIEKWGPVCAEHKSRSKLEVSLRNNTAVTPGSQVLNKSCWKGKKNSKPNAGCFPHFVCWLEEGELGVCLSKPERNILASFEICDQSP